MANAFIEDSYKLVFPLMSSGYLELNYDDSIITSTTSDLESSGVLVNGAVNNNSSTTITVDTVDATTKFAVNDTVYTSSNVHVGNITAVTSTQITLVENNKTALSNNDNLKRIKPDVLATLRERSIWGHDANFTIEAIVTPYDVNGVGSRKDNVHGVLDSQRTPPYPSDAFGSRNSTYESVAYLGASNYLTQKMMLFHNQYVKLWLENTTSSSYNQPAEYKVKAQVTTASGNEDIETDTVIKATSGLRGYYDASGYYDGMTAKYQRVSTTATGSNPTSTVTIGTFGNLERNTKSTGQIVVSGDIANYASPVNATGSITIANRNGFNTDVLPVAESAVIKFGNQPVVSDNEDANNFIQIVNESGGETTKWFARSTGTNGDALSGNNGTFTWPTGARQYNIGGSLADTATNFRLAVRSYSTGFGGTMSGPTTGAAPVAGLNDTQDITLTAEIQGSAPNRVGATSATLTFGSSFSTKNTDGSGNTIAGSNFVGGIDEDIVGESTGNTADSAVNYITIANGAGLTKNYFPAHDSGQATGSTGTRTLDDSSTVSVVYFNFASNGSNANAAEALKDAINHSNGHSSSIQATRSNAVVNLAHGSSGAGGNSATLAKTNVADSVATISGANFTGGVDEANATNTPFIQLIDNESSPTTKKYVPVKNGDALGNGNNGGGSIGDVSGGIAFQEGASASATADNLRLAIAHSNGHGGSILTDSAGSATINLTQNKIGANTTAITLTNLSSNISKTNFSGGATPTNSLTLTDAAGTQKKYKASQYEVTGTTDGTYTFFKAVTDNNTTAANLETAIDGANGHNGTLITSRTDAEVAVRLNQAAVGSSAVSENVNGLTATSFSTTTNSIVSVGTGEADNIGAGNRIYDSSATLLGTVSSVNSAGDEITLSSAPSSAVTTTIYTDHLKEALYLEDIFKVSFVFYKNGSMELYVNNALEKKKPHSLNTGKLHPSDCRIGRGSSNQEQFFGELFEIAMHKGNKPCATVNTLTPSYSDIMFYYSFGD
jgi:hypothetical protein